MSRLIITEFKGIGRTGLGETVPMQAAADLVTSQAITLTNASVEGDALNAQTRLVRLFAEADCTAHVGVDPVATEVNSIPLAAGMDMWLAVGPGWSVAAIQRVVA